MTGVPPNLTPRRVTIGGSRGWLGEALEDPKPRANVSVAHGERQARQRGYAQIQDAGQFLLADAAGLLRYSITRGERFVRGQPEALRCLNSSCYTSGEMRPLDNLLQSWRMRVAADWVVGGSRLLDVGCHQGEFLGMLGDRIGPSVGIDPLLRREVTDARHRLLARALDESAFLADTSFDAVSLLATLEHIRAKEVIARQCRRLLRPGGRLIITVPSPMVDTLLAILAAFRLVDGMSVEQHHGFRPEQLPAIFEKEGFRLLASKTFQLGLNNLFVFERR